MAQTPEEKQAARIDKLVIANDEKTNDIKRLRREVAKANKELEIVKDTLEITRKIRESQLIVPKWMNEKRKKDKRYRATAVQCWSDFHFGEVQTANEIDNTNAYSDVIAEMRFKELTKSSIQLLTEHTAGIDFDGVTIAGLGDVLTGTIHDELTKTNSETVFETVVRYVPMLASAIEEYANKFGNVYINNVNGNHDRNTAKVEHKRGPQETIAWVLWAWLADRFRDSDQVHFVLPESWESRMQLYNTRFVLTHGYGTPSNRYGAALALMKQKEKYARRDGRAGFYDEILLMGHYHQTVFTPEAIMSGCLKGIDAYAWKIWCEPAPPSQALFLVTPEHGITTHWTVQCEAKGERKLWDKVTYSRQMKK